MRGRTGLASFSAAALMLSACAGFPGTAGAPAADLQADKVDKQELASTGRNPYLVLEPGYVLVLEGGREQLVITVTDKTKVVDGVETRVIEERHTAGGQVEEISLNYVAISRRTNDVYYFGEDVDNYRDGRVVNHDGSWLAGVANAKFGLLMPGTVTVGATYYQEQAPRIAMDHAKIVSINETVRTPAGEFTNCVKVEETTPLEPGVTDHKYHAPGVGLIQDGSLKLTRSGMGGASR